MFNTINTKPTHFTKGFFSVGSGPTNVLIFGSCRVVPYLSYFHYLNADDKFTLRLINCVNFYFDESDKAVDPNKVLEPFESNHELLSAIKSTDIFIHEHAENFGLLNTSRHCQKNIYQFGMNAKHDLAIPNWNDIHLMFQEYVDFDPEIRRLARFQLVNDSELSTSLRNAVKERGLARLEHFLAMCKLSSFPEFGELFRDTWREVRFFWTGAHISNQFSMEVFRMIATRIGLNTTKEFWNRVEKEDLYAEPHCRLTSYDVEAYGLKWPQAVEPLKIQ